MASFDRAIGAVLKHEGGYVNDPADPGGETKFGISKRAYPHLDIKNLTVKQAKAIYKRDYWRYDRFRQQRVAGKVFDMAVNMGHKPAHRILQQALNAQGFSLKVDGIVGRRTLGALNRSKSRPLMDELRALMAKRYAELVLKNRQLKKFLRGWMRRAVA